MSLSEFVARITAAGKEEAVTIRQEIVAELHKIVDEALAPEKALEHEAIDKVLATIQTVKQKLQAVDAALTVAPPIVQPDDSTPEAPQS